MTKEEAKRLIELTIAARGTLRHPLWVISVKGRKVFCMPKDHTPRSHTIIGQYSLEELESGIGEECMSAMADIVKEANTRKDEKETNANPPENINDGGDNQPAKPGEPT